MRPLLNRKQYLELKKKDHAYMNRWVENIYMSGYKDGQKAAEGLGSQEIRKVLKKVKGIGEKRTEEIIIALETALEQKNQ